MSSRRGDARWHGSTQRLAELCEGAQRRFLMEPIETTGCISLAVRSKTAGGMKILIHSLWNAEDFLAESAVEPQASCKAATWALALSARPTRS